MAEVNLDAMDVAGEQQNGIAHDLVKTRLSAAGVPVAPGIKSKSVALLGAEYCGSCYGAETDTVKVRWCLGLSPRCPLLFFQ